MRGNGGGNSHKKLRTFGKEWGVKKDEGKTKYIEILMKGNTKKKIEVKEDGIMTHLGVIWNMDMHGRTQWEEIKKTIERIGEEITRGKGRMRDKIMVVNYCLKATVLYRLQHCTWSLGKYKELDRVLNAILRKVTKNMKNYPAELINADRKHGGLGIRSLSDEANERKLNIAMKGINRDDQTGHAICGLVARGHRVAGKGGLEDTEMKIEESLGPSVWVTSLLQWLSEIRLGMWTCGRKDKPEFEMRSHNTRDERIDTNRRGIVLKEEGDRGNVGGGIPLRVGQCWMSQGEIVEVLGFNEEGCEVKL